MSEAEVSLRLAFYLLDYDLAASDVEVAIDGAQVKTGETIQFRIGDFIAAECLHCPHRYPILAGHLQPVRRPFPRPDSR